VTTGAVVVTAVGVVVEVEGRVVVVVVTGDDKEPVKNRAAASTTAEATVM
jgi:hypothetical protein